jgi:hypothetical protein
MKRMAKARVKKRMARGSMAKAKVERTSSSAQSVLASVPKLNPGRCYLVIGPYVWGKAFGARQAWANADKPGRFIVYDAPPDVQVDEMGGTVWVPDLYTADLIPKFPDFVPIRYPPTEIARHGVPPEKGVPKPTTNGSVE